jgi:hypothetical protein
MPPQIDNNKASLMPQKCLKILFWLVAFASALYCTSAGAWSHEVAFGYGNTQEPEQDYNNSIFVLSGKFLKFRVDKTLIATLDGTIGQWHAQTDEHSNLTNFAISPAFRAYFANPDRHTIRPYLGVSVGPTYLSEEQLGTRVQNTHFALQSTLETGTEIGNQQHSVDLNVHLVHICNAGLAEPNQGFNVLYVFSIGYQF